MDMKLEVVMIGVTDIERAIEFYDKKLGFHLDIDQPLDDMRFIQFTPHGSACSVVFGKGFTKSRPGAIDGLMLVVKDIEAQYKELLSRGVDITKPKLEAWGSTHSYFSDPDGNGWTLQQLPDRTGK
jgi:catechol 2,3-dioxygenase-like lactoylglutathione lyase family enzyme